MANIKVTKQNKEKVLKIIEKDNVQKCKVYTSNKSWNFEVNNKHYLTSLISFYCDFYIQY